MFSRKLPSKGNLFKGNTFSLKSITKKELTQTTNSQFSLSRKEKITIAMIFSVIALVTAFAFSAEYMIGRTAVVLAGLGIVAYVFGLRHGVDADHIAAIDNTTRKLIQEGKRPFTVGM